MQNNESNAEQASHLGNKAKAILSSIEKDWREMCGNDLRPTHAALEPLQMEETLPYAFVLKRAGPGKANIRVAGQRVHDYFNEDLAGCGFDNWFQPSSAEFASELLEAAFTLPAIVSFAVIAKRGFGRQSVNGQILLLPMRDAQGNISRILGALVTDGTLPSFPLRFELDHSQAIRWEPQEGQFPDRRARSRAAAKSPETRAHLRLVVNNT